MLMTKSVTEQAKYHLEWGDIEDLKLMAPEMAMEIGKSQRKINGALKYLGLLITSYPDVDVSIKELRRARLLLLMGGDDQ